MAGVTYRCCIHCADDVVHDVPDGEHDLPCTMDACPQGSSFLAGRAEQRAADIAKIEALLEPWTWRNYMGRFSPPRNAGLQAALDALREGDTT